MTTGSGRCKQDEEERHAAYTRRRTKQGMPIIPYDKRERARTCCT